MDSMLDSVLDGNPSISETRMAKLRRSCESCRASKGRCCPSIEENRCQKCMKEGKQCIFLEAKPRPKRSKNSRTRVAEMEQKLDSLYALLSTGNERAKELTAPLTVTPNELSPRLSFETTGAYQPDSPLRSSHRKVNQQFQVFSLPFLVFDEIKDLISKGIISFEEAEESIRFFRTMGSHFPFIYISPQTPLDTLRREKPFLLLSILTFGAQFNAKLQRVLELELLESLGKQVFVGGKKSLDLLQGLLVYLTWYHLVFDPGHQQSYQLSQLAAAMAIDLGINRRPHDRALMSNSDISALLGGASHSRDSVEELERRRTFLGSYYVSSSMAISMRKPSMIAHSEYIEECSQLLAYSGEGEFDHLVPYFVRLQRFAEEVNKAFEYDTVFHELQLDPFRVEILTRNFRQQLSDMEMTFPPEIWNNITLTTSYCTNKVYLYEVGFHTNAPSSLEMISGQPNPQAWHYSSTRNDSLITCLQVSKEYIEKLLSFPPSVYLRFTLNDYVRLIYVILVLSRFNSGCGSPTLDAAYMRKSTNLDHYLERLIAMTLPLFSSSDGQEIPSYVFHVRRLFQASKHWLSQSPLNTALDPYPCAPELSFMDIFPTILGCPMDLATSEFGIEKNPDGTKKLLEFPYVDLDCSSVDPSLVMTGGTTEF